MLSATTLSDLIYNNIQSEFGAVPGIYSDQMRKFTDAIASAIVTHITTDARALISTTDSGLQRDAGTATPTLAPLADKTLAII